MRHSCDHADSQRTRWLLLPGQDDGLSKRRRRVGVDEGVISSSSSNNNTINSNNNDNNDNSRSSRSRGERCGDGGDDGDSYFFCHGTGNHSDHHCQRQPVGGCQ